MCRCGSRDPRRVVAFPGARATPHVTLATAPPPAKPRALFEYVGATALTVVGPATGLRYRFERTGARLQVDPRDRAALEALPQLRARA